MNVDFVKLNNFKIFHILNVKIFYTYFLYIPILVRTLEILILCILSTFFCGNLFIYLSIKSMPSLYMCVSIATNKKDLAAKPSLLLSHNAPA